MKTDGHIRLLPTHVANKIAAGEVVERPASVLKELMENALDAGAKRIVVNAVQGGRKLISVRDDGCGMSREDAVMSLERQATSKIRDVDDIEKIDTLGFRGEAVPSIASVSRFTLTTRPAGQDEGTILQVEAGTLVRVAPVGAPPGTTVEVRDLFCNVPARRKFLRAIATEEAHVRHVFVVHALAHPDCGFTLLLDNRETYNLPPNATLGERIRELFGADYADRLLPVDGHFESVHVTGYIERPDNRSPVRREQFIFTNNRPATAAVIASALAENYPRSPGESKPGLILFITLPPEGVDVNVHPAKREVRFRRPSDIRQAITDALTRTFSAPTPANPLSNDAPLPVTTPPSPAEEMVRVTEDVMPQTTVQPATPVTTAQPTTPVVTAQPATENLFVTPFSLPVPQYLPRQEDLPISMPPSPEPTPQPSLQTAQGPWRWFKVLALTDSGYVIIETDAGLITLNPHAARERIAYEALLAEDTGPIQQLLLPETLHLSPSESARLKMFADVLRQQGFDISEFGSDTWKIDAVPQIIGNISPQNVISSVIYDLQESGGSRRSSQRWREELIAKSVARSYSGAAPRLTPEAAEKLVSDLGACRMPYVCPRGKAIMIFMSNREISRKFDI